MFDLIIRNGTLIDGQKTKRYRADLAINGDRIVQIGDLQDAQAHTTIDAANKIVAPGFVDVHTHSDGWLLKTPHIRSNTSQGFTTEVIMADGISYAPLNRHTKHGWLYYLRTLNALQFEEYSGWESLADYMVLLDGKNVQNSITHIPYANVRSMFCGWGRQVPDDFQMNLIISEVEAGMAAGAVGLSTGLDYIVQCFSSTDELVAACAPLVAQQGLYVTHMRYKMGQLAALKEAVEIGKQAGIPVHISHLKSTDPQEGVETLHYIDTVAVNEVDFSFDVYPYIPGSTMLNYWLPYEVWEDGPLGVIGHLQRPEIRARFAEYLKKMPLDEVHIAWVGSKDNSKHQGKYVSDYVAEMGLPPEESLANLLLEENLAVLLVLNRGDDTLIEPFLSHPKYMMGSDGIYHEDGYVHPRQYGSAPRLVGPLVRDRGLFTLEEAVYKLTSYPAQRFGLHQRGILQEGWFADVVVFDAETVQDKATFEEPHQHAEGIEQVIVNGVPIVQEGEAVENLPEPLPGRALRFKV